MTSSLLLLFDDIAAVLDDVATMTKVAAKKAAGVLGDDLALNAQQVTGVRPARELAVVWAVARGSALNKLLLVPAALSISWLAPWAVTPLLVVGGAYLCFEGAEKILHRFLFPHPRPPAPTAHQKGQACGGQKGQAFECSDRPRQAGSVDRESCREKGLGGEWRPRGSAGGVSAGQASGPGEPRRQGPSGQASSGAGDLPEEPESERIFGAIRTDFILSAEIIVITLGVVAGRPLATQLGVLFAISAAMTVGVYGLVAAIVKLDDLGGVLAAGRLPVVRAIGRGILATAPWLMRSLSIAGTVAMFLVGGGIIAHAIPPVHDALSAIAGPACGLAGPWTEIAKLVAEGVVGLAAGLMLVGLGEPLRQLTNR